LEALLCEVSILLLINAIGVKKMAKSVGQWGNAWHADPGLRPTQTGWHTKESRSEKP